MSTLGSILLSPITLPAKGLMYPFTKVFEQAEREFNDPANIRNALIALQMRLDSGQITEQMYELAEAKLLARLDAIEARRAAEQY